MPKRNPAPEMRFRWVRSLPDPQMEEIAEDFSSPAEALAWLSQQPELAADKSLTLRAVTVARRGAGG